MKRKLSFVIPCYRSEHTISDVVKEIKETVEAKEGFDYEVILVNDGSPDSVLDVIVKLCKNNKNVKGINLSRNFGQHSAIITGLRYVTGDIVICLDDDGQTPANEVFKLIDELDNGRDIVFAKYETKHHSGFRNFGSKVNDFMACTLIDKPKDLSIMSYFACRRFVADEICRYNNPYPYISGLLLRTSRNISNVSINHRERKEGSSNYTFSKLIGLWLNGFTAFSIKPLRFATLVGCLCSVIGFIYAIVIIIRKITMPTVVLGYASIMATMLFIGGMIMLMLGLIGEYIGRTYISINQSPQAIVRDTYNIK